MSFELFDPKGELYVGEGTSLPHWYQPGVTYFVTFRTDDSIPSDVSGLWHRRRDDWLRHHGVDPKHIDWKDKLNMLSRQLQCEFHDAFSREFLESLDRGFGECVLKRREVAAIVGNVLRYFDGDRYTLGDFVVMPNHVHLTACLLGDTEIEKQCTSWKKNAALQINRALGRKNRFWQEESFDHLVRSPEQFEAILRYIANNPAKAGLACGEFLHETFEERKRKAAAK